MESGAERPPPKRRAALTSASSSSSSYLSMSSSAMAASMPPSAAAATAARLAAFLPASGSSSSASSSSDWSWSISRAVRALPPSSLSSSPLSITRRMAPMPPLDSTRPPPGQLAIGSLRLCGFGRHAQGSQDGGDHVVGERGRSTGPDPATRGRTSRATNVGGRLKCTTATAAADKKQPPPGVAKNSVFGATARRYKPARAGIVPPHAPPSAPDTSRAHLPGPAGIVPSTDPRPCSGGEVDRAPFPGRS